MDNGSLQTPPKDVPVRTFTETPEDARLIRLGYQADSQGWFTVQTVRSPEKGEHWAKVYLSKDEVARLSKTRPEDGKSQ